MTRMSKKRLVFVGLVIAASCVCVVESSAASIRSGVGRNRNMSARQRATTRIQANRAIRLAMSSGTRSSSSAFQGLKGASLLSTSALSIDTSTSAAGAVTSASTPTLQEVWQSLAPTMRYASLLEPDPNTGLMPDTAFVADLLNRRAVNQARFDTYHPQIAQLLDYDTTIRNTGGPSGLNPAGKPSVTNPQVVIPEPSSIFIAVGLVGFVAWNRRNRIRLS